MRLPPLGRLMSSLSSLSKPTVWHEFSPLASASGAVNLGQGFPNWDPPGFVKQALKDAVDVPGPAVNQYCRSQCHLPLATALADEYKARPSWSHLPIDPLTNIVSSVGCTQVMYCAFRSLLSPGDEVLLLEPAFDIYASQVKLCGAEPRFCSLTTDLSAPLTSNDVFKFDWEKLEAAITEKTRVLVLNTPHNPTGKMFSMPELSRIAEMVEAHPNLLVFSDEVCVPAPASGASGRRKALSRRKRAGEGVGGAQAKRA
jgi:kynurenine--oxoglutarate transaminase/cysteine-S-conjugate beta-lyase/glutamine--phenylpyruvate transaminase